MRNRPPPGKKRVGDWKGLRVRSVVTIRNGFAEYPVGTRFVVDGVSSKGLRLQGSSCPCCGVTPYTSGVSSRDIEPLQAGEPGVDPREGAR